MKSEFNSAVVLITHDMGVVAEVADRVIVMYAGRVVEHGTKEEVFNDPQHPYTWGLLGSIPRLDRPRPKRLTAIPGQPAIACQPARRAAISRLAAGTSSIAAWSMTRS